MATTTTTRFISNDCTCSPGDDASRCQYCRAVRDAELREEYTDWIRPIAAETTTTKCVVGHEGPCRSFCPSIPERVTAVQARLQTLLDTVKVMGIQLGAWERAMTHRDAAGGSPAYARKAGVVVDDAEAAVTATIEKLEQGTY